MSKATSRGPVPHGFADPQADPLLDPGREQPEGALIVRTELELRSRIAALEAERWRIFEDAQREADRVFAQYQLSQLLASGDSLTRMAEAVLEELLRHNGASVAALWLAAPGQPGLQLVATVTDPAPPDSPPLSPATAAPAPTGGAPAARSARPARRFSDVSSARSWSRRNGWSGATLEESRDLGSRGVEQQAVGFVALAAGPGGRLEPDHERFLALIRHELAIAFRAAQLREILARERSVLSAILDGASDAIVAVDRERRVVRANEAALGLFGPEVAVVGAACHEALGCERRGRDDGDRWQGDGGLPGGRRCGARCPFDEVLEEAGPVAYRDQSVVGPDGSAVPLSASYARMPGPDPGAVAVLRDLRPSRALDELKASFVAAVSHELRTPLALIGGYTDSLLHLDLDTARQREYVERIGRAAKRLADLVNQIVEISRLESDRLSLDRRSVRLSEIVATLTAELAETPDPPSLAVRIPADLPRLDADPVRVGQILGNLVSNAAKYGGAPGGRIRIRARRDGAFAIVTVQDDGPGIEPEEREHVFERFYRGRAVRETSQPGSGLGLYLCRRLVEAHGGRIWLDEVPAGTSVSLSLPVAAAHQRDGAPS